MKIKWYHYIFPWLVVRSLQERLDTITDKDLPLSRRPECSSLLEKYQEQVKEIQRLKENATLLQGEENIPCIDPRRYMVISENSANEIRQPGISKRRRIVFPPDADGIQDAAAVVKLFNLFGSILMNLRDCVYRLEVYYGPNYGAVVRGKTLLKQLEDNTTK